jgi:Acyl-CoA dehydrogenase, C-terminal domain
LEFLYLAARGHRHLRNDFEIFRQILASQLVGLKVSYHFDKVEVLAGSSAVGIFGGYGYLSDFPVEQLYRGARVTRIYEGTNDIQHLVILRELTRS